MNPPQTRFLAIHGLVTCIYVPVIVSVLVHLRLLYDIGKYSSWPLILVLFLMEGVKMLLCSRPQQQVKDKNIKPKKTKFKGGLRNIALFLTVVVIYYILAVLFGAPVLKEHEETLMFSILLATLTALPVCMNLNADEAITVLISLTNFQGDVFSEMLASNVCYTLVGAWLGASVIPLDWDKPWQVWPVPCSFGAILGFLFAHVVCLVKLIPKFARIFVKKTGKYGL